MSTDHLVTDAAVEAAARAMHERFEQRTRRRHQFYTPQSWEQIGEECQQEFIEYVRPALAAAAPYLEAKALRDAAQHAEDDWREEWDEMPDGYAPEPVITTAELRLRADELEAGR